jgi:hypothetical protein
MSFASFTSRRFLVTVSLVAASVAIPVEPALAQATEDAAARNWSNASQLSWVMSTGNSNINNFSLRNVY